MSVNVTIGGTRIPEPVTRLAAKVTLERVMLRKATCEIVGQAKAGPQQLGIDVRTGGQKRSDGVEIAVGLTVKYLGDSPEAVLAVLDCDFLLSYRALDAAVLGETSDDVVEAFAAFNGTVNTWPYARELCQNMAWRMLLPPTTLPSFRHEMFPELLQNARKLFDAPPSPASEHERSDG